MSVPILHFLVKVSLKVHKGKTIESTLKHRYGGKGEVPEIENSLDRSYWLKQNKITSF